MTKKMYFTLHNPQQHPSKSSEYSSIGQQRQNSFVYINPATIPVRQSDNVDSNLSNTNFEPLSYTEKNNEYSQVFHSFF